jgi:hypothetical protein
VVEGDADRSREGGRVARSESGHVLGLGARKLIANLEREVTEQQDGSPAIFDHRFPSFTKQSWAITCDYTSFTVFPTAFDREMSHDFDALDIEDLRIVDNCHCVDRNSFPT